VEERGVGAGRLLPTPPPTAEAFRKRVPLPSSLCLFRPFAVRLPVLLCGSIRLCGRNASPTYMHRAV